ncbi:MAG: hypothetical protein ACI3VA_00660 [Candidatus Limivicinus sp.]
MEQVNNNLRSKLHGYEAVSGQRINAIAGTGLGFGLDFTKSEIRPFFIALQELLLIIDIKV